MTPAGTLVGTLGPETCGCIDINDGEFHVHVCAARPGGTVRADEDTGLDWETGKETRPYADRPIAWLLGNTIDLVPFADLANGYPQCCILAEYAESDAYIEALLRGEDAPYAPLVCVSGKLSGTDIEPRGPEPHATFQWKGTTMHLTWTCTCGTACKVAGAEFAYSVACPSCRNCFTCGSAVPAERVHLPDPK